ncbi:MAG: hypothetical protein WBB01_02035, partial [Phormidesmis sp.]
MPITVLPQNSVLPSATDRCDYANAIRLTQCRTVHHPSAIKNSMPFIVQHLIPEKQNLITVTESDS